MMVMMEDQVGKFEGSGFRDMKLRAKGEEYERGDRV